MLSNIFKVTVLLFYCTIITVAQAVGNHTSIYGSITNEDIKISPEFMSSDNEYTSSIFSTRNSGPINRSFTNKPSASCLGQLKFLFCCCIPQKNALDLHLNEETAL